ncbi:MAG: hypothetical protein NT062_26125, partial [Proteobacteria bacterium]|nr:hypothetical protein [Pseudomonadota bacterium]
MNARTLALVSFAALLLPSVAAAEASFYVPLNDETLTTAKVKIRELLAKEGRESKLGDLLLELDAFASLDDDQCPGFTVDVLNASNRTLWAVAVTVEQESGTKKKSDVVHLPYLPAHTQTKVAVTCLEDYSYSYSRYSMYDKSTTISVDPYAKSPRGLAEGLGAMVSTKADTSYTSATLTRTGPGARSLLEVALEMNDPAITKELVAAIASTGVGAKELGAALATNEALAAVVAEQLATLPANQQAKLARALLASTAAEKWVDQLTPLIDKLCGAGRPEVVALWAAAQGPRNIPVASLRDRVRGKCTLLPTDAGTLVASLESAPTYAGDALDATTDPVFAAVVAKWKAAAKVIPEDEDAPTGPPPSLYAYLANTNDHQVIALGPATSHADAITAIVQGTPSGAEASPAAPRKQAWLDEAVASSDAKDKIVGDLFGKLLDGHIKDPAMRLAVRALKVHAPHEADGVIIAYTNEHSKVYDSVKLGEAGIDVFDFLAFATEHLADCPASLEALEACADAVAASKLPLTKHGDALQPEFASSVQHLVSGLITKRQMVDSAKRLTAVGWSVQFA